MEKKILLIVLAAIAFYSSTLTGPVFGKVNFLEDTEVLLKESLILHVGSPFAYVDNQQISIDPVNNFVQPVQRNGRVLVPLRFIGEQLGAQITWHPETSSIELLSSSKQIVVEIGKRRIMVNGLSIDLDVPAQIVDNRTFVPLRALAEALEKKVFYYQGVIVISNMDNAINPDNNPGLVDELMALFNERGNTQGNFTNGGLVAEKGDWIYYRNISDEHYLYKVKKDGTEKVKLNSDWTSGINVYDGWIYYINESDNGRVYKIKTDGTDRQRVNNTIAHQMIVVNGWIYYDGWQGKLYKMKIDGSSFKTLTSDGIGDFTVSGEWLYFTLHGKRYSIYKMKLDGTGMVRVSNEEWAHDLIVAGDWIFYGSAAGLCKVRTNGQDPTIIADDDAYYINISGDWVYYFAEKPELFPEEILYKIRPDGTEKTSLGKHELAGRINATSEQLYYQNLRTFDIYKMKKDGSEKVLVD